MNKKLLNFVFFFLFTFSVVPKIHSESFFDTQTSFNEENRVIVFEQLLDDLQNSSLSFEDKNSMINSFFIEQADFELPIVHNDTIYFTYYDTNGLVSNVSLSWDYNGDNGRWESFPDCQRLKNTNYYFQCDGRFEYRFTKVNNTKLFYLKLVVPPTSWFRYSFVICEPKLNEPEQEACTLANDGKIKLPGFTPYDQTYKIITETNSQLIQFRNVSSEIFNTDRFYHIYLPPNFDNSSISKYNSIYFTDGIVHTADTKKVLDYLITEGTIDPIVAVFVHTNARLNDYVYFNCDDEESTCAFDYMDFLERELVPHIDSNYNTKNDPKFRAHYGWSNGAFITGYISKYLENTFKLFGLISPSFWINESILYYYNETNPDLDKKFFMAHGIYESTTNILGNAFAKILEKKGYDGMLRLFAMGHEFEIPRYSLRDMLEFLFTDKPSDYSGAPIFVDTLESWQQDMYFVENFPITTTFVNSSTNSILTEITSNTSIKGFEQISILSIFFILFWKIPKRKKN